MVTQENARKILYISIAALACLLALGATAFARGNGSAAAHRTGAENPRIDQRHAVVAKHRKQKARHQHRRHQAAKAKTKAKNPAPETSVPGSPAGSGGAGGGSGLSPSAPVVGSGTGAGTTKKTSSPTKSSAPVTETPVTTPPVVTPPVTTPPVTTPPVVTPPAETPTTPTPPVGPTQSTHCFAAPHLCGFPDPTNTGVPAGTTLTPSGSLTITRPGTVVSGLAVTGTINVLAANVTIENTRITQNTTCGTRTTCGNYAIRIDEGVNGTVIRHVETASAPGDTCEHDIRNTGGTTTIEAAYLHACDSNVYAAGPTTLKDSYGIAALAISEDHVENIYFNETAFTAVHVTLLNPVDQTAVIFGNSGGGYDVTNCSNQLTVLESLIAGGGYTLYPCAHAAKAGTSTLNVQGNHFGRCLTPETYIANGGLHPCSGGPDSNGYYPKSGVFGIATNYFQGVGTWRGNVWDDNLGKVCISGGSSGCE
jgi:hypothetical protein